MEIELLSNKGVYEIWADGAFVATINRHKGEADKAYDVRAEYEYSLYVTKMKSLKSGDTRKTIKKTVI